MPAFTDPRFDDCTDLLSCGVYVLERAGRVIFVGKTRSFIDRIAKHRELRGAYIPPWLPIQGIYFDHVYFRRCAPDIAETLVAELIAIHHPHLNEPADATAA